MVKWLRFRAGKWKCVALILTKRDPWTVTIVPLSKTLNSRMLQACPSNKFMVLLYGNIVKVTETNSTINRFHAVLNKYNKDSITIVPLS